MNFPLLFRPSSISLPAAALLLSLGAPMIDLVRNAGAEPAKTTPPAGMALIPTGAFVMGDENNGKEGGEPWELPEHALTLSAFYIDKFEVTKALWDEVRTWGAANGYSDLRAGGDSGKNHPVQTVSWYDAVKWCNARSEKAGLTPVYYTDATRTTVYREGEIDLKNDFVNWEANGYRLPTEAEWEKAARGGLKGQTYPWGDSINGGDANYKESGDPFEKHEVKSSPIGYYDGGQVPDGPDRANGYGLYDMAGNVFEWCWDQFGENYYESSPEKDPRGPAIGDNGDRVLRGGSWSSFTFVLRCAFRFDVNPVNGSSYVFGFRSARGF